MYRPPSSSFAIAPELPADVILRGSNDALGWTWTYLLSPPEVEAWTRRLMALDAALPAGYARELTRPAD